MRWGNTLSLIFVTAWLLSLLGASIYAFYTIEVGALAEYEFVTNFELPIRCVLIALLGGILYCLRGVYLNYCVHESWSAKWLPWYIIRPFASSIMGFVSFVALSAGLIVLEAEPDSESTFYGYLFFAFIAGLNVDKFVVKIEDLAKTVFGIEKSRTSQDER